MYTSNRDEQVKVMNDVLHERDRQDFKFGEQNHDPAWWMVILAEEVGEASKAICDWRWGSDTVRHIRQELIQSAAVAIAAVECLDRGQWEDQITTAKPSDKRQLKMALNQDDEDLHARYVEADS